MLNFSDQSHVKMILLLQKDLEGRGVKIILYHLTTIIIKFTRT